MLVIPAIDIKNGKCVRLRQGEFSEDTIYSDKPEEVARAFHAAGARRLHIVDLDGAKSGVPQNTAPIQKIVMEVPVAVQLGGGIRSLDHIAFWFNLGVKAVILGTLAVEQPEIVNQALKKFSPERIILSTDARNGMVAIQGWQKSAGVSAIMLAQAFKSVGLKRVLYTDISRDGMLCGPNLETTRQLALSTGLRVTASGGISSVEDLKALQKLEEYGVDSVVVGRAFYEGRIRPAEVL